MGHWSRSGWEEMREAVPIILVGVMLDGGQEAKTVCDMKVDGIAVSQRNKQF